MRQVPSANAIRKGKVPPPASCVLGDGDSTDEMSEDSSSIAQGNSTGMLRPSLGGEVIFVSHSGPLERHAGRRPLRYAAPTTQQFNMHSGDLKSRCDWILVEKRTVIKWSEF